MEKKTGFAPDVKWHWAGPHGLHRNLPNVRDTLPQGWIYPSSIGIHSHSLSLAFGYGWPLFFPPKTDRCGYMGKPISARLIITQLFLEVHCHFVVTWVWQDVFLEAVLVEGSFSRQVFEDRDMQLCDLLDPGSRSLLSSCTCLENCTYFYIRMFKKQNVSFFFRKLLFWMFALIAKYFVHERVSSRTRRHLQDSLLCRCVDTRVSHTCLRCPSPNQETWNFPVCWCGCGVGSFPTLMDAKKWQVQHCSAIVIPTWIVPGRSTAGRCTSSPCPFDPPEGQGQLF